LGLRLRLRRLRVSWRLRRLRLRRFRLCRLRLRGLWLLRLRRLLLWRRILREANDRQTEHGNRCQGRCPSVN
jgi:hypothetical protein